jgi:hypothetical protein
MLMILDFQICNFANFHIVFTYPVKWLCIFLLLKRLVPTFSPSMFTVWLCFNWFDFSYTFWPPFLEIWSPEVKIVVYYNRHEVKQSRDTQPLRVPRKEKYSSVWRPLGLKTHSIPPLLRLAYSYFPDFLPLVIWRISDQYNLVDFLLNMFFMCFASPGGGEDGEEEEQ